ncbi:MAG: hypothetical protein BWY74_02633 [Firmicutes bacterium ADurb.Bin419]|nr:MAG: hypothetical protein BWY74_02633 [Firmicutes bacterium ADurb.Bin419]
MFVSRYPIGLRLVVAITGFISVITLRVLCLVKVKSGTCVSIHKVLSSDDKYSFTAAISNIVLPRAPVPAQKPPKPAIDPLPFGVKIMISAIISDLVLKCASSRSLIWASASIFSISF